jgi:Coenzyme PQQ synthesis protein D (PqqD)
VDPAGLVTLTVPKFTGKLGKTFCKVLKKENTFEAHFDKLGSAIWTSCEGTRQVKDILEELTKQFPQEKNLDQRLFLFLQQLKALNYLTY